MRRDQQPANTYLSGSGLPIPVKGSRKMASIKSRTRSATRRSVSTQERKSSRNCGWNAASNSTRPGKAHLLAELVEGLRFTFALSGLLQGFQKALCVFRRKQEGG